jgi:2,4-dienoyl-CoA reductase-like NADH-dependent reductase (Old Yellow Enzyme family)
LRPFQLKGVTLKNRIVSTPHAPAYAEDGKPKLRYQLYHEEKAKGGIGMTMFGGSSFVASDSPSVFGQLDVSDDSIVPYFEEFSERIHRHSCALICQISHLGRRTTWSAGNWFAPVAPSRVKEPSHRAFPKAMDKHDIRRIVAAYAAAAGRCKDGQLDGCEILSHGHLPEQFLSPATNMRADEYGGSMANRLRFTIELLEEVRQAVGQDFILGIRLGGGEDFEGGLTKGEGLEVAKKIEETGLVDYISINFGHIETDHSLAQQIPGMWSPLAPRLQDIVEFRKEIHLPLIHACRIADLASARYAIDNNILDLVGMVRAHIADPHIVRKLTAGKEDAIRPCVGANYCLDRVSLGYDALCLHNAATGREATMPHVIQRSTGSARKVVVVGGGPAGLEAARVSAERGHKVVLFEATGKLGGQIIIAAKAGWRRDLIGIVDWYSSQLEKLGADIRWHTTAGAAEVRAEHPDIVIIATGGVPDTNFMVGGDLALSVWDVLAGKNVSGSILIYDDNGQAQAPSCADFLAGKSDVTVELVTPDRAAVMEMGVMNYSIFMEHFHKKGVAITPGYRIKSIDRSGNQLRVSFSSEYNGPDIQRIVDHVVVEHGTLPLDDLYFDLCPHSVNEGVLDHNSVLQGVPQPALAGLNGSFALYRVGDAVASRNIHAAIYDSLRLCKDF